jgi:hypothetical protein
MSLQIRRGSSTQLANITPVIGELIYTTDTQVVYVGDGSTAGGIPVAVGGSGNVSGTNLLTLGIVSAAGNVTGGNILTNGQVSAAGNVSADYFIGNGAGLTGLVASVNANSLTGTVLNSNVVTSSLTSFGTLTSLSVLGNVRTGNAVVLGEISSAGNITGGNVSAATYTGVRVSVAGNITGGNISTPGTISATGVINTAGNIAGANLNTLGQVSATGNIIGAYFTGDGSGLTNITASANTLVGSYLSSNVVNSSLTSFGTLTSLSVSGNVAAGNVSGILTTAAQNNITSVGTLSSLSVTANILGGNLNTGGQVSATGNIRGNYLRATLDINAGGNITGVNFTGAGVSVTGNITGGNISTAGALSTGNLNVTGTITGNILTSGIVSAAGNVTGGNILTSGIVSATSNVTGGNILTGGTVSATGNITGGNVTLSDVGTLRIGNLTITDATIDSTEHQITLGSVGNVGNIIIAGNLQVLGNTTTINSNTVSTNDLTLNLANNAINSAAANGGGIEVGPVGSPFITWLYNSTANTWNTAGGISATGNVTGGGFVGTVYTNGIVNTGSNSTGNIGSASTYFNTVFAKATSAQYADLAENYLADADYAAGTVVVFGGEKEITIATEAADERVAGVISTNPAYLMNSGESGLPVALRGKVPVRVIGPVTKGDSLVTSTTPGVAFSVGRERVYAQAVFAKSLETNSADGEKVIIAVIL